MKITFRLIPPGRWILPAVAVIFLVLLSLLNACMEEPPGIVIPCAQPKGLQTYPANGDTNVPLDPVVTVTFDTTKNPSSFDSTSIILVHGQDTIGGSVFYQPTDTTLFFIPDDSLEPQQPYTVVVTVPTDSVIPGSGGPLGPSKTVDTTYTLNFTTTDTTTQDTVPVPEPPAAYTPIGSVVIDYSLSGSTPPLTLHWFPSSGAVTYRMQISTSPLFTTTVFDLSGIPQNSPLVFQGVSPSILSVGTYYWRADATNSAGTSAWSNNFVNIHIAP